MIIRDGKIICEGYECNSEASYVKIIDGHKFQMCFEHKDCLNHPRVESLMDMIESKKMNGDGLKLRFNFKNCGFSWEDVKSTVFNLINSGYVKVKDGFFFLSGNSDRCPFPGCDNKLYNGVYCFQHRNMPEIGVILDCVNESACNPITVSTASKMIGVNMVKTRTLLSRLVGNGVMRCYKMGLKMFYEAN